MATVTISNSNSTNTKTTMQIQLDYTISGNTLTINSIKGRRTDGYLTQAYNASGGLYVYVNIGGTTYTCETTKIDFIASSSSGSFSSAWSGVTASKSGLSGNVAVTVTYDTDGITSNIDNAKHTTTIYVAPVNSSITNDTSSSSRKDFGSAVNFTITRPDTSTTHTLTYSSGGTSYTIGSGIATSQSYTFPTSLISNYPNSTTADITVSNKNSYSQTSTTTVYLQVPTSYVPTASIALSTSSQSPDGWGGNPSYTGPLLIQGVSTLTGTITASGVSGSTISSYSTTAAGKTYTSSSFTTPTLTSSGYQTVSTTVKDSRGRTTTVSKDYYVLEYSTPKISNITWARCTFDGTLSEEGTYGKVSFDYDIAPGEFDTNYFYITLTCNGNTYILSNDDTSDENLSESSGSYTSGAIFSDLATTSSYATSIEVQDAVYGTIYPSLVYSDSVAPSAVTVSKLAGGKGISFGQTATEEGLHSYMESTFHEDVTFEGRALGIFPVGAIYMSVDSTSPASLFGGTWEALTDRFLIGAGSSYTAGTTGGSTTNSHTHTLSHTHSVPGVAHTHGYGSLYAAICFSSSYFWNYYNSSRSFTPNARKTVSGTSADNTTAQSEATNVYGTTGSTTPSSTTSGAASTSTTSAPSSTSIMPPYLAVYMWKRTA